LFSMKLMFAVCVALSLVTAFAFMGSSGATFDVWTAVAIGVAACSMGSISIVYLERKRIGYRWFVQRIPADKGDQVMHLLQLGKIVPADDYVLVQDFDGKRLIGHAYVRITDVPYLIDDLDKERKLWYVGNFVRILSTLTFTFEIIPRVMPVSTEALMKSVNKEMEDLQLTLSAEGSTPSPSRKARLKHLERISQRLLTGERARDVSFMAHVITEAASEAQIAKELDANTRTMISALESGLGIKAERLKGSRMLEAVQEFFRATAIAEPSKPCRMLSWDLAYLIPLVKPKLPPTEKLLSGAYLGRTAGGSIVCLDLAKYANPHLMMLGKSGYGKSTTAKTLASRIYDLFETPILIIDYAGEYKDWVFSRGGLIVDMRTDTINPFELGAATLTDRIRQLVDAFHKNCDFKTINQRNAFTHYVVQAYKAKGYKPNDQSTWKNPPPTLAEVTELMEHDMDKLKLTKQLTVQSLIDRLQVLCSGPFGVFGPSTVSIDKFTKGFTCIDLSRVTSNSLKDMIAWTVLQYIDSMMRLEGVKEEIRLIIVLDEAWKLCRYEDSLPVTIIKEGRKYGYSLWVSSQDATADLAESILANAGTAIIHHTEHPKYLNFFKSAYGLTEQELSRIQNLPVGEALIKLGDDPRPFFVKVDMEQAELDKSERIEQSPQRIYYTETGKALAPPEEREKTVPSLPSPLSDDEKKLLKVLAEEAVYSVNDCYEKAGIDRFRGNKAKGQLLNRGLIQTVKLPATGIGRRPVGLILTEKGVAEAKNLEFNLQPISGRRGGLLHRYLIDLVSKEFQRRGCKVLVEHQIGDGKAVDLVINDKVAVEVETGDSDIEANIDKLLGTNFEVLFVCADAPVKRRVEDEVKPHAELKRVTVAEVRDLPKAISSLCPKEVSATAER